MSLVFSPASFSVSDRVGGVGMLGRSTVVVSCEEQYEETIPSHDAPFDLKHTRSVPA